MRMFVALTPPAAALADLADFWEPRTMAEEQGMRWADREQWHLTLAFLENVPERKLDDLEERLSAAARRRAPFQCRLRGGGAFPDATRARVLWVGVEELDGGGRLGQLADGVRASCNRAGATPAGGRFRPHVSLARFSTPRDVSRWIRVAETYEGPAWHVTELQLVESRLGQGRAGRPLHTVVGVYPLGR